MDRGMMTTYNKKLNFIIFKHKYTCEVSQLLSGDDFHIQTVLFSKSKAVLGYTKVIDIF